MECLQWGIKISELSGIKMICGIIVLMPKSEYYIQLITHTKSPIGTIKTLVMLKYKICITFEQNFTS